VFVSKAHLRRGKKGEMRYVVEKNENKK